MNAATWAERQRLARTWLRHHADALPFDATAAELAPVPNWGGFVNASYRVSAGDKHWHLKLAAPKESAGLQRWAVTHERLSDRYFAPRMIASGAVPETLSWGALFEHLEGTGSRGLTPGIATQVAAMLAPLHADGALAEALSAADAPGAPQALCGDHYLENHDHRFRADLHSIPPDLPCLAPGDHDWMWQEVEALERLVRSASAFQESTRSPVHGDLWADNLLVAEDGSWGVIDWDDLRIGDPVVDYATVFGPAPHDLRPVDPSRLPPGLPLDSAARARMSTYARATLLDWVIDPLADWVEAEVAGADAPRFRSEKERIHLAAKALYRERWG